MAQYQITGTVCIEYVLVMNLMRDRIQNATEIRRFDSMEDLRAWYNSQLVAPYVDEGPSGALDAYPPTQKFNKTFMKGSEMEWFNPLTEEEFTTPNHWGHGVHVSYHSLDIQHKTKIGF